MARQLKPQEEDENENEEIKQEVNKDSDTIRVVTENQLILNELAYIKTVIENINIGLEIIITEAGFNKKNVKK